MSVSVPISFGELWDKYTILLIKQNKIKDETKLNFVILEIKLLDELMNNFLYNENELFINLYDINQKLWDIEDKIRIKEKNKSFDNEFIELARSVYYKNDIRAEIKKQINILFDSNIHEVKYYVNY